MVGVEVFEAVKAVVTFCYSYLILVTATKSPASDEEAGSTWGKRYRKEPSQTILSMTPLLGQALYLDLHLPSSLQQPIYPLPVCPHILHVLPS